MHYQGACGTAAMSASQPCVIHYDFITDGITGLPSANVTAFCGPVAGTDGTRRTLHVANDPSSVAIFYVNACTGLSV